MNAHVIGPYSNWAKYAESIYFHFWKAMYSRSRFQIQSELH